MDYLSLRSRFAQVAYNCPGQRARRPGPAEVWRQSLPLFQSSPYSLSDPSGCMPLADVVQQQSRRKDQGNRVGEVLSGNIRRTAVNRFKNRIAVTDVGTGDQAQTTDQSGAEIADYVAEQVLHDQHVKSIWVSCQ